MRVSEFSAIRRIGIPPITKGDGASENFFYEVSAFHPFG